MIAARVGLGAGGAGARFFMVEETGIGRGHPFSGEKLSLVLARLSRARLRPRQGALPGAPRLPGPRPLGRHPHPPAGARPRARRRARRGPGAGQPGAHLRQRRRLRQRPAVHAVDGLRHLGRQLDLREPELAPLHQRHPSGDHDPRGPAERGGAVRPLLASATADELRGACREAAAGGGRHRGARRASWCSDAAARGRGRPRSSGPASSRRRSPPASAARRAASGPRRRRPRRAAAARAILGMAIGGYPVERLLVERRVDVQRELYAAVLTDAASKGPLILASAAGGIDVEELAARAPDGSASASRSTSATASAAEQIAPQLAPLGLRVGLGARRGPGQALRIYADHDAELVEINPLALAGRRRAGRARLQARARRRRRRRAGRSSPRWRAPELRTPLEQRGAGARPAPDRARRRRRRAGERRRAHHDHHGRGPPLRRRARELPRDRRRGLPARPAGAGAGAGQSEGAGAWWSTSAARSPAPTS